MTVCDLLQHLLAQPLGPVGGLERFNSVGTHAFDGNGTFTFEPVQSGRWSRLCPRCA